jgi:uncharacterized protein (TIGR02246 family)
MLTAARALAVDVAPIWRGMDLVHKRRVEIVSESPMQDVMARWNTAFDAHETVAMADLFTSDALFQGFGPTVISGRDAIREYYDAVSDDRRADVKILSTYTLGDDVAGGFADVTFSDPVGWEAAVHLSLVLQREGRNWLIRQYHVSLVMNEH